MNLHRSSPAFWAAVAIFTTAGAATQGPADVVKPPFEPTVHNPPGKSPAAAEALL